MSETEAERVMADDVVRVPSMDTIRRLVVEDGSSRYARRSDWVGVSGDAWAVIQRRWRLAVRETCEHPYGFKPGPPNVLGNCHDECWRCGAVAS